MTALLTNTAITGINQSPLCAGVYDFQNKPFSIVTQHFVLLNTVYNSLNGSIFNCHTL